MTPRFLLDEQISPVIAENARAQGVDVRSVMEEGLAGSGDLEVLRHATQSGRIVVTFDIGDFSILLADSIRSEAVIPGIVFISDRTIAPSDTGGLVRALVQLAAAIQEGVIEASSGIFLKPTS